jgi:MFS family permease
MRRIRPPLATTLARWRALHRNARLYLLSNTIQAVSVGAALILYTLFLNALGYKNDFIGQVVFLGTLGGALGILPAGLLLDRLGWRMMLLGSDLLGGGALLAQFLLPTTPIILVGTFLAGVSVAMVLVVNGPLLTDTSTPTERTALFGLSNATSLLASVVGSLLGGFLPEWLARPAVQHSWPMQLVSPLLVPDATARSYQVALLATGALALPSLIPVLLMREERAPRPAAVRAGGLVDMAAWRDARRGVAQRTRQERDTWRACWRERLAALIARALSTAHSPIARFSTTQVVLGLGAGMFGTYLTIYFVRDLHATTAYFGTLTSAVTVLLAGAALLSAPLAARYGKLWLAVAAQLVSVPFLLALGVFPILAIASLMYALHTVCMNVANPALSAFYMETVPAWRRGLASSVYNGAYQGAIAVGALIGGPISDAGGNRWLFVVASPLYVVSVLLLALWFARPGAVASGEVEREPLQDALAPR